MLTDFSTDVSAVAPTVPTEVATAPDQLPYLSDSVPNASPDTAAGTNSGGGILSGLTGVFSTVGNIFTTAYQAANPTPPPTGVTPPAGYYWDRNKGQFVPTPGASTFGSPNVIIFALLGVVLIVALAGKKK